LIATESVRLLACATMTTRTPHTYLRVWCIHIHISTCVYTFALTHAHTRTRAHTRVHLRLCNHSQIYTHTHMHTHTHASARPRTHEETRAHTYTNSFSSSSSLACCLSHTTPCHDCNTETNTHFIVQNLSLSHIHHTHQPLLSPHPHTAATVAAAASVWQFVYRSYA